VKEYYYDSARASPVYWPWYATLPLALLALLPYGPFIRIALMLSFGARLGAPLEVLADRGCITPTGEPRHYGRSRCRAATAYMPVACRPGVAPHG